MDCITNGDVFCNILKLFGPASILSLAIAFAAYQFSKYAWSQSNRPFVTARVVPIDFFSPALNLILTNSGNRPAKNVKLSLTQPSDLYDAYHPKSSGHSRQFVENCFGREIPVIANGKELSASFGSFNSTWKNEGHLGVKIGIKIEYSDIEDGRRFCHSQNIWLIRVDSFGTGAWKKPPLSVAVEQMPVIKSIRNPNPFHNSHKFTRYFR